MTQIVNKIIIHNEKKTKKRKRRRNKKKTIPKNTYIPQQMSEFAKLFTNPFPAQNNKDAEKLAENYLSKGEEKEEPSINQQALVVHKPQPIQQTPLKTPLKTPVKIQPTKRVTKGKATNLNDFDDLMKLTLKDLKVLFAQKGATAADLKKLTVKTKAAAIRLYLSGNTPVAAAPAPPKTPAARFEDQQATTGFIEDPNTSRAQKTKNLLQHVVETSEKYGIKSPHLDDIKRRIS